MTEGNFCGCCKLYASDWLFFLGYVPHLKLRLVLKLSCVPWVGSDQSEGLNEHKNQLKFVIRLCGLPPPSCAAKQEPCPHFTARWRPVPSLPALPRHVRTVWYWTNRKPLISAPVSFWSWIADVFRDGVDKLKSEKIIWTNRRKKETHWQR